MRLFSLRRLRLCTIFLFLCLLGGSISCGKTSHPFRIGVDPTFFPLDIKGKEANVFAFSNELLTEISKIKRVRFERVNMSWDNLIWGLKEKKYEAILSSIYPYNFNQKKYSFSNTYLLTGSVLIVRENMNVGSIQEMEGKEVGVEANSGEALLLDRYPKVLPHDYLIIAKALLDLEEGKIDGILLPILQASAYVDDLYRGKFKIATRPEGDEGLRLITLANEWPKLIAIFDHGLEALKENGTYEKLLKKWDLSQ